MDAKIMNRDKLATPLIQIEDGEGDDATYKAPQEPDDELQALGLPRQTSADSSHTNLAPYGLLEAPSLPASPMRELFEPLETAEATGTPRSPTAERPMAWWRKLLEFTGPGWLMSIAYIDPGNLEADLQCGALFGYRLLWALCFATAMGLGMQLVAARLGCATRRHLAEHCQENYPTWLRILLWVMTELAIIGSDIQEVIGSSVGLNLLFGFPLSVGVVITAFAAFAFLFLERLGTRPLEIFFGILILVLAVSMGYLFQVIQPDAGPMIEGVLFPRMPPPAVKQVVGMLGCVIMPHNLFLHSALVQSRVVPAGKERNAVWLFTIESTVAIFTSLLINGSVVAVFAKGFFGSPAAGDLGLVSAGDYLGHQFGSTMQVIWALGLCASGQSSTMTGAYAGQWVMQGYLQLKVKSWKRALITRSMAIFPCFLVAIHFGGGGSRGLDAFNVCLNVLQSVVLPFAVVPLLTFAGNRKIMGDLVLGPGALAAGWACAILIMMANLYLLLVESGMDPLSGTPASAGVLLSLFIYTASIVYVAWAPRAAWRRALD